MKRKEIGKPSKYRQGNQVDRQIQQHYMGCDEHVANVPGVFTTRCWLDLVASVAAPFSDQLFSLRVRVWCAD
uniref:Uncharacterized protein n=1 Tax=Salix viminalis TaxID=40686 RepID=A0A6N2NG07_SALVM